MRMFKILVGKAQNEGNTGLLKFNGDYYTLVKRIQRKDGTSTDIDERIELPDLAWDKSNPTQLVGYYTAFWLNDAGETQSQERVITVLEEIKLEIGL